MSRLIFPLILGIGGCAILIALGIWQLQRLEWKGALLADREARINAAPVALPDMPDPHRDQYLPVRVTGEVDPDRFVRVLASQRQAGAGYRIISALRTDGRTILIDRGFVPLEDRRLAQPAGQAEFTGNLLWPDDTTASTPEPDLTKNIWFSRDVAALADALGAEPVLLVVREGPDDAPVTPQPVDTSSIPNDHLEYAITWFSLAAVWAGMTGYLLWRIRRRTV